MPIELRLLLGAGCAALLVYSLTPVAIRAAGWLEFFDKPVGYKGHQTPTPYLGGAAVMAGFLLALCAVSLAIDARQSASVAGGVAALWAVGTLDDRHNLSPGLRAAIEALVATALWALGVGWDLGLGAAFDLVCTIGWILVVVNAFNLFDNMDGQSSTMALVVATAVAALGLIEGNVWLAATAGALAGSCLGFLPHNMSSPARIFLGDGGSMPLGFVVAALVMIGASDAVPAWQALLVGLMLVGVPALDTALVIVSRRRRGISVLTGGQDHLTHRTRRRFHTTRRVATVLGGAQALVAALALFSAEGGSAVVLAGVLLYLAVAGATIALLEAEEKRQERARAVDASVAERPRRRRTVEAPALVALSVLGAGAGLSPFWFGFYDSSLWAPIGLLLVVACAAALLARPLRTSLAGRIAFGGATGLAVWTLLSSRWAESAQQAVVEGNRALVAVAVLALAMVLVRGRLRALWLVGALGTGILVVAADTVVRLLLGDGSLFLGGRLNDPLGYVNSEATVFLMGLWIAIALAERRRPLVAGLGLAVATVMAGLALLALSRGAALALLGSTVVVVVLVPGRLRRVAALGLGVLAIVATSRWLLAVSDAAAPTGETVRAAGVALLLGAAAVGVLWAAAAALAARIDAGGGTPALRRVATGTVVVVTALAVSVVAWQSGHIGDTVRTQYRAFTELTPPTAAAGARRADRLVSGSGNRYDYWRVGARAFEGAPLAGLGGGNFDVPWFRDRTVVEDVRQPHSIEIQVLSETGIVGGLLLLLVVVAGLAAFMTAARRGRTSASERLLAVACIGGATTWFVHTSIDWMHLMPGLTAIALCLLAVAARRSGDADPRAAEARAPVRAGRVAAALLTAVVLVLAGASLTRQALAERSRDTAQQRLAADPAGALRAANRSLKLDDSDVLTYYAKAAALARFDRGPAAEATLEQAIREEPNDFVTWALLGDLRTRLGASAGARRAYERAARLNPLDAGLSGLAKDARARTG